MSGVADKVATLSTANLEGLRTIWRGRYGTPPPLRSVPIMRQLLSWRVQAEAHGGLDIETRRLLRLKGSTRAEGLHLGVGAVLKRQWQGREVRVEVVTDGFAWDGKRFKSLSAAATAIAGSRWNGPRFFGLREA